MTRLNQELTNEAATGMSWTLAKKIDEQRAYPRLELHIPIAFRNADGQRCKGEVADISPDGVQVRCNLAGAQILHPAGGRICPSNAPIVQLAMDLPLQTAQKRLVVGGQLIYASTRETEPRCVIGLQFLELRPMAQKLLDQFFGEQMHAYFDEERQLAAR
jgi:hypothetical protein